MEASSAELFAELPDELAAMFDPARPWDLLGDPDRTST
jgi:hypothetical protein